MVRKCPSNISGLPVEVRAMQSERLPELRLALLALKHPVGCGLVECEAETVEGGAGGFSTHDVRAAGVTFGAARCQKHVDRSALHERNHAAAEEAADADIVG